MVQELLAAMSRRNRLPENVAPAPLNMKGSPRLALAEVPASKRNVNPAAGGGVGSSPVRSKRQRLDLRTSSGKSAASAPPSNLKATTRSTDVTDFPLVSPRATRTRKLSAKAREQADPSKKKRRVMEASTSARADSPTNETAFPLARLSLDQEAGDSFENPPDDAARASDVGHRMASGLRTSSPALSQSKPSTALATTPTRQRESSIDSAAAFEADYVRASSSAVKINNDNRRSLLDEGMLIDDAQLESHALPPRHMTVEEQDALRDSQQLRENKLQRVESYIRSAESQGHGRELAMDFGADVQPSSPALLDRQVVSKGKGTSTDEEDDEFGFLAAVRKSKEKAKRTAKQPESEPKSKVGHLGADIAAPSATDENACQQTSRRPSIGGSASSLSGLDDKDGGVDSDGEVGTAQGTSREDNSQSEEDIFAATVFARNDHRKRSPSKANKKAASSSSWNVDSLVNDVLPKRRRIAAAAAATTKDRQQQRPSSISRGKKASGQKAAANSSGSSPSKPNKAVRKPTAKTKKPSPQTRRAARDSDEGSALTELSDDDNDDGQVGREDQQQVLQSRKEGKSNDKKRRLDDLDDYKLGEEWVI